MPFAFGGTGTGGGGGGLQFRNPADEFTGADLAACRTARDTYFATTAGTAVLPRYQGNQSLAIILNPTNSTDNEFETYLPGQAGMAYDNTQWVDRTDAIEGNVGAQGRFEIIIHTSATSAPATPTGGSYNTAAGTLTPPTGWTEAPTVPGTSEDVYASQAVIDPETQSGTVTPVWSVPVERSHLSSGISHVETSADFTGSGIAGDVLGLANPVGISQVETSADFTGAGIAGDVLGLANPITPNPSDAPTAALLSFKYGGTTYNVDEIIDVTATGLPALTEANHRSLFIDFDTPRVWIGHRVHNARVDATGTFAAYAGFGYLGAFSSAPPTSTGNQNYYDTSRHAWYISNTSGAWVHTGLSSLISGGRWLGEFSDDATAVNAIVTFVSSNTYVFYNTTTGTVRVLDSATYVAPQDPVISYQVEPISAPGGIVSAITGLTAGAGLTGGGTSGVVSVSVDVAAADFPTIPVAKGGTGAVDVAAARAALAVLTQAQVDARAVSRFSDAEKTKLNRLMVGAAAVDLGSVTLSSDRLTAAAPSGYIHYTDVTLLIFRVGTHPDPSWAGNLDFYVGSDRYDLHKSGEGDITYSDFRTDTSYLAVAHNNAVQLLGPFDPTDAQVGDRAFSNPPSNLTDTEKTAVRTAIDVPGGGFTLHTGAGIPASTLGVDGDWYLRTTNGAMYQKGSGAWLLIYTDQQGQAGTLDGVLNSLGLTISGSDVVATAGRSIGSDVVSSPLTLPFLPLAGGTLTGALSGSAATFTGTLTAVMGVFSAAISATGLTLSAALTGVSATFSGAISAASATVSGVLTGSTATFSGLVSAATAPTADAHLANKAYVDAAVAGTPMSNHNRYLALGSDAVFTEAEYTGGTRFNSDAVTFPTFTGSMFPGIVVPATNPVTTFTQLGTFNQDLTSFFTQLADRNIGGVLHQEWVGTQAFPDSYSGIQLRVT